MEYRGNDNSEGLQHWKYIKRKKVNGKWRYYYPSNKNKYFDDTKGKNDTTSIRGDIHVDLRDNDKNTATLGYEAFTKYANEWGYDKARANQNNFRLLDARTGEVISEDRVNRAAKFVQTKKKISSFAQSTIDKGKNWLESLFD